MSFASIVGALGIYGGTFVVCIIAGLVPVINAEVFLIGRSAWALHSPWQIPGVVVCAAAGQMVAKTIFYFAAMGVLELPTGKKRAKIEKFRATMDRWQDKKTWVILASSILGLPPFYIVSLLAGAMRMKLAPFIALGFTGRVIRFSAVLAVPWHTVLFPVLAR